MEAPVCLWEAWGLDDDNGGVDWGSSRYNNSEWTSPTAEVPLCLWGEVIDNYNGGVHRVRRSLRLNNNNGGICRGRVISDASKGSKTTTEVAGDRRQDQIIYDNNRGVRGGKCTRRLQQQQRMHQRRIDDTYKGSERTSDAAVDWQQARWIGNNNGVLIFLSIGFLTVTLPCICLLAVSFWYCFYNIPFFPCLLQEILSVLQSCGK